MQTLSSEAKETSFAYNAIGDFFDGIGLFHARRDIDDLVRSAADTRAYKKATPGDLLFLKERLEELIAAAFTISVGFPERAGAIIRQADPSPDLAALQDFAPQSLPAWAAMPRHLSNKQYFNPYKAVRKFVAHQPEAEWKKTLKKVVEYALADASIEDEYAALELMLFHQRLLQLVEACHLIHVRTNR